MMITPTLSYKISPSPHSWDKVAKTYQNELISLHCTSVTALVNVVKWYLVQVAQHLLTSHWTPGVTH